MKKTIATLLVALFLAVPVFSQNRERRMDNRGEHRQERLQERTRNRERENRQRIEVRNRPPAPVIVQHGGERFEQRQHRGPRVVIVPRLTFRFPFFYRGYKVINMYDVGRRDGFYRGRQDYRLGYPCDHSFIFDFSHSTNEQYRLGFIAGYDRGCRWR